MYLRGQSLGRCGSGDLSQTWSRSKLRETAVVFAGTEVALGYRSGSGRQRGARGAVWVRGEAVGLRADVGQGSRELWAWGYDMGAGAAMGPGLMWVRMGDPGTGWEGDRCGPRGRGSAKGRRGQGGGSRVGRHGWVGLGWCVFPQACAGGGPEGQPDRPLLLDGLRQLGLQDRPCAAPGGGGRGRRHYPPQEDVRAR